MVIIIDPNGRAAFDGNVSDKLNGISEEELQNLAAQMTPEELSKLTAELEAEIASSTGQPSTLGGDGARVKVGLPEGGYVGEDRPPVELQERTPRFYGKWMDEELIPIRY